MSAPAITADETRPLATTAEVCRLCHRGIAGVSHVQFTAQHVSESGSLVGEDSYVFCWECTRIANQTLRALDLAAAAGERRARHG